MQQKLLKDLIEEQVPLGKEAATGFKVLRCAACADYKERAGFKFDGDQIIFACFNCGKKAVYEEGSGKLSASFKRILTAFGLSDNQLNEVTGSAFFNKKETSKEITLETLRPPPKLFTPEVELPLHSYLIGAEHHKELQIPLIEYLLKRQLDPTELQVYFSLDKGYLNRVIVPCLRNGKIIYWQARTIIDGVKPRYMSPGISKEAVLWGYDNLYKDLDQPLFITEGIFDAASIKGVALLGSKLNETKLEILNRCHRRKIVVVDRDKTGKNLAELALQHSWDITFPPEDDVNNSVQKYGLMFTTWSLMKNITDPSGLKTSTGISLQSQLKLGMELALAKLSR